MYFKTLYIYCTPHILYVAALPRETVALRHWRRHCSVCKHCFQQRRYDKNLYHLKEY